MEIQPILGAVSMANAKAASTAAQKVPERSANMPINLAAKRGKTIRDSVQLDVECFLLQVLSRKTELTLRLFFVF